MMSGNDSRNIPRSTSPCGEPTTEEIKYHKDAIARLNEELKKHQNAILELQKRLAPLPEVRRMMSLEDIISKTYRGGVSLTMLLFLAGMARFYMRHQSLNVDYSMFYKNFYQFTEKEMQFISLGHFRTEVLLNCGLMILLITPMVQVLLTGAYLVAVNKNWKYGLITLFVLAVLSISLLMH
ncbi:MAG: DUF1634 domain-containing protein [Deltaproteobacteria bacterium]|nr:DUF1634 domain-containing protein [Deltaproteobacteria bacterium]MCL5277706.1 DUF1634 domain-containing protein [Deltaproteobacteria bacterium]